MGEPHIKSYQDLLVWQRGMALVKSVYSFSDRFPEKERFGLTGQMRRCAVSVPSNIAEGWGRGKNKFFGSHLRIARGSLYELETQYLIAVELGYGQQMEILTEAETLSKMINSLLQKVEQQSDK